MLEVPDWVLHPDIDLNMFTGLWLTHIQNFVSILIFKVEGHPCALSPHLGLFRMLEVPDWGLTS